MSEQRREQERFHPQPIPSEIAKRFVAGKVLEGLPVEFENEKEIVRRLFRGGDVYSGIPGMTVYLDHHQKKEKKPSNFDRLDFDLASHPVFDGPRVLCAQMHFEIHPSDEFRLVHRLVKDPDQRKEGLGTRLFQIAQEWFLQVAKEKGSPVTLSLGVGQKSVLSWVEGLDFSVDEDSRELRRELDEHPERFFEDEVIVSDDSRMKGVVKDRYTFRVGTKGRYMEDAIRLTLKKTLFPSRDSSVDGESPSE